MVEDVARAAKNAAQLVSQAAHVELQGVPAHLLPGPHLRDELGVGDQPAFVQHQAGEEAKFGGGQGKGLLSKSNPVCFWVEEDEPGFAGLQKIGKTIFTSFFTAYCLLFAY